MKQPELETERLLLRPLTLLDAPQIQLMASKKQVSEMTANIPYPYPDTGAVDWISLHQSNWEQRKQANFGITLKSTKEVVGCIGLVLNDDNEAELGYWVGVDYWGNGYATEAAISITDFGLNELELAKILACRLTRNPASGKVLLKAGLVYTGTSDGDCGSKFESIAFYERVAK